MLCVSYTSNDECTVTHGFTVSEVLSVFVSLTEDTVSADEEDDEVKAHDHPRRGRASVRHDPIVHNSVPVFSSQDLKSMWEIHQ